MRPRTGYRCQQQQNSFLYRHAFAVAASLVLSASVIRNIRQPILLAVGFSSESIRVSGYESPRSDRQRQRYAMVYQRGLSSLLSTSEAAESTTKDNQRKQLIANLYGKLQLAPPNLPTPTSLTREILEIVNELERRCPTNEFDVLAKLRGNWILEWTAQDKILSASSSLLELPSSIRNWVNPIENQAYSNRGKEDFTLGGRLDPVLPRPVQDFLERLGILRTDAATSVRSSQSIDVEKKVAKNVVTLQLPGSISISLTVSIGLSPAMDTDARRVDVKFNACRVVVLGPSTDDRTAEDEADGGDANKEASSFRGRRKLLDVDIPLGLIGPTGWIRTTYIDDNIRITRGHKGSVFLLSRPAYRPPILSAT
jgi:PAP_fibrillin